MNFTNYYIDYYSNINISIVSFEKSLNLLITILNFYGTL